MAANAADDPNDLHDLFHTLFEQPLGSAVDLRIDVRVTAREARAGARRELEVHRAVLCAACGGTGRDEAAPPCSACDGNKRVTRAVPSSSLAVTAPCTACGGRGHDERYDCGACDGGLVPSKERVVVEVPAGVEDGQVLRVTGKGRETPNGAPGDLYVAIAVEREEPSDTAYRGPTPERLRHDEARAAHDDGGADAASESVTRAVRWLVVAGLIVLAITWLLAR